LIACTRCDNRALSVIAGLMMTQDPRKAAQSNLERLQAHLKKDCLAETLVTAAITAGDAARQDALRKVVADRLEEIKRKHEPVPDQQA
jgi:hypothetical protein